MLSFVAGFQTRKIPRSVIKPPSISNPDGISPKTKAANRLAPRGSPRTAAETIVAGKYFKVQLSVLCPKTVGTKARAKKIVHVCPLKPVQGRPVAHMKRL